MNWILLVALAAGPIDRTPLCRAEFARAEPALALEGFTLDAGQARSAAGSIASVRSFGGDVVLTLEVASLSATTRLIATLPGGRAGLALDAATGLSLTDGGAARASCALAPRAPFRLALATREEAVEVSLDGRPLLAHLFDAPLGGGRFRVEVAGGEVALDALELERLDWWGDQVRFDGDGAARVAALRTRPKSDFSLAAPAPGRIDPVFRIAVAGEPEPLVVRHCGVRPEIAGLALLDQALAYATLFPYLAATLRVGDEQVAGDGPFGPYRIAAADERPVVLEVAALVGIAGEWPTLTLEDVTNEQILDRTVPGGPMGRGIYAELSSDTGELMLTLDLKDRERRRIPIVIQRS